jgi:cytochrome c oxidase subunit IV
MNPSSAMNPHQTSTAASTLVWLLLLALTLTSLALGQSRVGGVSLMLSVLGISVLKGQLIVDHFMGMRRVRLLWRILMMVYLALVGGLIAVAYLLGLN